jgi:hypothetical protein
MSEFEAELSAWLETDGAGPEYPQVSAATLDRVAPLFAVRNSAIAAAQRQRSYVRRRLPELREALRPLANVIANVTGITPEIDVTTFGAVPEVNALLRLGDSSYHNYTNFAFHLPHQPGAAQVAATLVIGLAIPIAEDGVAHVFGGIVLLHNGIPTYRVLAEPSAAPMESALEARAASTVLEWLNRHLDEALNAFARTLP